MWGCNICLLIDGSGPSEDSFKYAFSSAQFGYGSFDIGFSVQYADAAGYLMSGPRKGALKRVGFQSSSSSHEVLKPYKSSISRDVLQPHKSSSRHEVLQPSKLKDEEIQEEVQTESGDHKDYSEDDHEVNSPWSKGDKRRRDNGKYVETSRHQLHNGYIILYNAALLKRYQCHINIEWCNQTGSIKYLFKYINKGPDRVSAQLYESVTMADGQTVQKHVDEIKAFYDCRYISTCEAAWRIFGFKIHYRTPYVERLSFHLPGEQQVVYDENPDLETVIHQPSVGHSMFEGWMKMNELYPRARGITYAEFPTKYVWNAPKRIWTLRKLGRSIGRIHSVPISTRDAYYCRMLLNSAKGCMTHDDIKRLTAPAEQLHELFVTLLSQKELTTPLTVWLQTWHLLAQDDKKVSVIQSCTPLKREGVYYVYGYEGTRKTFLWKTLAVGIRRRGDIVLNVASSGIASFAQSDLGALIKKCKLVIRDEAPMANKLCFEALDRSLPDILRKNRYDTCEQPFGNMTMVFRGDFRQVLPVISKGSWQDIVSASLKQSYLWDYCNVLKLTANMRLTMGARHEDVTEIREFAEWILKVEDGKLGEPNDGELSIDLPEEILIDTADDP
ncbi:ATP-dependent DNA helicase PIF1-like protein, partial [Tanacetum coccineum]